MDILDDHDSECSKISWKNIAKEFKERKLSIICVNLRSMINKFAEFVANLFMLKSRFSFIIITETWLKKENDIGFEIPGYKSQAIYRDNTIGGGVKIYYQDHIKVTLLENYMGDLSSFEGIFLRATVPGYGIINVISVYRPPSRSINDFFLKLNDILESCHGSPTLLACYLNIDVKKYLSAHNENLTALMTSHGFRNNISLPTYVSPISKSDTSCIDHVWDELYLENVCNWAKYF